MTKIDPTEAEDFLLGLFEDEAANGDGGFFEYVGLPHQASWGQFWRHYDTEGLPDEDRAANDLASYPPIAQRIAEWAADTTLTLDDRNL